MAAVYYWCRTAFFLIPVVVVYTVVLGIVALTGTLVDPSGRLQHWCGCTWARLILVTAGVKVESRGADRLDPKGAYVFVANHQSLFDIPVMFCYLPYQWRIIAKKSLGVIPILGWYLHRAGHILVDRRHPDRLGILRRWREVIARGLSLVIFPEGTRSVDGRVGRFKAGSFQLALEARVPVVPVSIVGTRAVMRKNELTVRPGLVQVTIHAPVLTDSGDWGQTIDDARRLAVHVQEIVSASVAASAGAPAP
jgi:1-acyl-sn-glycerol-3-phosphate acyltransferase